MKKSDEIKDPRSCFNRAGPEERVFVLLARDAAAPATIRAWVTERIRLGKNKPRDGQIVEALECAALMEKERDPVRNAGRPDAEHFGDAYGLKDQ